MIYLDSAATSLLKPASVEQAVVRAMRTMASPGRGGHRPSMLAAEEVYNCRSCAAELFNVPDPEKIVFTSNATHGLNIAINALVRPGSRVVISGFEHNSVTRPLKAAGAEIITAGRRIFDSADTAEDFARKLKNADAAVCTMVSNAFGYILPVYEIAELAAKMNVPLIIDASQAAGVLPVDFQRLNAAYIAMPGHKGLHGPQGTGILICGQEGKPLMQGGSGSDSINQLMPEYLPDRLEAGTHNVCGIAGLRAGIEFVHKKGQQNIFDHEKELLRDMAAMLRDDPDIELFYDENGVQSGVLSFRSPGKDCETISRELDERGVCTRPGLHCAPFAHESAGTLETGTVRLSFSPFITRKQVCAAAEIIKEIVS